MRVLLRVSFRSERAVAAALLGILGNYIQDFTVI